MASHNCNFDINTKYVFHSKLLYQLNSRLLTLGFVCWSRYKTSDAICECTGGGGGGCESMIDIKKACGSSGCKALVKNFGDYKTCTKHDPLFHQAARRFYIGLSITAVYHLPGESENML